MIAIQIQFRDNPQARQESVYPLRFLPGLGRDEHTDEEKHEYC